MRREASIERKARDPADVLATWADIPYTYADIGKARRMLGYNPTISVQEGVGRFLAWYEQMVRRVDGKGETVELANSDSL